MADERDARLGPGEQPVLEELDALLHVVLGAAQSRRALGPEALGHVRHARPRLDVWVLAPQLTQRRALVGWRDAALTHERAQHARRLVAASEHLGCGLDRPRERGDDDQLEGQRAHAFRNSARLLAPLVCERRVAAEDARKEAERRARVVLPLAVADQAQQLAWSRHLSIAVGRRHWAKLGG
eukprot:CAMPEP_0119362462 /NCGR_PEP_ID=MMETSP1334-20130426/9522_1 /TAXON_ID=127549 /ORGANISM="Calcidiscus leptoporus, Strain RCC1130" /LENGTH=181 /DNA_ID=CAMNT_0007377681 /DNA_START=347 /DNA_END=889 /DNA_ORIENTATION=+